jgi:hypothetical protein
LKHRGLRAGRGVRGSLPARGRGLKLNPHAAHGPVKRRSPRGGYSQGHIRVQFPDGTRVEAIVRLCPYSGGNTGCTLRSDCSSLTGSAHPPAPAPTAAFAVLRCTTRWWRGPAPAPPSGQRRSGTAGGRTESGGVSCRLHPPPSPSCWLSSITSPLHGDDRDRVPSGTCRCHRTERRPSPRRHIPKHSGWARVYYPVQSVSSFDQQFDLARRCQRIVVQIPTHRLPSTARRICARRICCPINAQSEIPWRDRGLGLGLRRAGEEQNTRSQDGQRQSWQESSAPEGSGPGLIFRGR